MISEEISLSKFLKGYGVDYSSIDIDARESIKKEGDIFKMTKALEFLVNVGLDYIKLGQPSTTLSGGEASRVKLAKELQKKATGKTLFIMDEPTTGLHFHDIKRLLKAFDALVNNGHTVVIVEHNMDIIKCADHIIDLGPEAGDDGGRVVFEGAPTDLLGCKSSHTADYLKQHIK